MSIKSRWIGNASPKTAPAPNLGHKQTPPASLEIATTITGRGMAPAHGVLERVSASECRLRSVIMFDPQAIVEFQVALPDRPPMNARGRIVERTRNGARFIYRVAFEHFSAASPPKPPPPVEQSDRDRASSRLRSSASLKDEPAPHGLLRDKMRQQTELSLQYRTARDGFRAARAMNISTGGLLLVCTEALATGMLLELQLTLPSEVLAVYPRETSVLDLRNLLKPRKVPSKLRRPFEEIVVQARVTRHHVLRDGLYQFGVAFVNIRRDVREEIARYVDAVRHLHLNKH